MWSSHSHVCFILIIFAHIITPSSSSSSSSTLAPAFYVLGDSLVDNGNNNWMPSSARANYFPYGLNFAAGVTGRFSNGKTVADFYAEYLGLPYPPPYVTPFRLKLPFALANASLHSPPSYTGYNFASAGSGVLPESGAHFGKCFTLDEQITLFERTIKSELAPKLQGPTKVAHFLAKSIFFLSVGSNDYINNYIHPIYIFRKIYDPLQFAKIVTSALSLKLQRLYNIGVRKLLITELGPLGCVPTVARGLSPFPTTKCDDKANRDAEIYNEQLSLMIQNLTSTLPGAYFIIEHCNRLNADAIYNPSKFGLIDGKHSCCKTLFNGSYTCIPELKPCSNPDKHYFWDGYHPTEIAYSFTANECIYGKSVCYPMNFKQLAQA